MQGRRPDHTGVGLIPAPNNSVLVGKTETGRGLRGFSASPAIGADGVVYIGNDDNWSDGNYVYALNSVDGSVKWKTETGGGVRSSPAIDADSVVDIGSFDSYVYALNSAAGSVKWKTKTYRPSALPVSVRSSAHRWLKWTIYVPFYKKS